MVGKDTSGLFGKYHFANIMWLPVHLLVYVYFKNIFLMHLNQALDVICGITMCIYMFMRTQKYEFILPILRFM